MTIFQGTTALHLAAAGGHLECVKELVGSGAQMNARDENSSSTALLLAMHEEREDVAMWLLGNGADVLLGDDEQTLPVHMAAAACGTAVLDKVILLMEKRAKKVCWRLEFVCLCMSVTVGVGM